MAEARGQQEESGRHDGGHVDAIVALTHFAPPTLHTNQPRGGILCRTCDIHGTEALLICLLHKMRLVCVTCWPRCGAPCSASARLARLRPEKEGRSGCQLIWRKKRRPETMRGDGPGSASWWNQVHVVHGGRRVCWRATGGGYRGARRPWWPVMGVEGRPEATAADQCLWWRARPLLSGAQ